MPTTRRAVAKAHWTTPRRSPTGPTIIVVHSIIGYGAPKKAGTREAHGEPLGDEEIKGAKRSYGWPEDAQFLVPDGVHAAVRRGHGRARRQAAAGVDGSARRVIASNIPSWRPNST